MPTHLPSSDESVATLAVLVAVRPADAISLNQRLERTRRSLSQDPGVVDVIEVIVDEDGNDGAAWAEGSRQTSATHVLLMHDGDTVASGVLDAVRAAIATADVVRLGARDDWASAPLPGAVVEPAPGAHLAARRDLVTDDGPAAALRLDLRLRDLALTQVTLRDLPAIRCATAISAARAADIARAPRPDLQLTARAVAARWVDGMVRFDVTATLAAPDGRPLDVAAQLGASRADVVVRGRTSRRQHLADGVLTLDAGPDGAGSVLRWTGTVTVDPSTTAGGSGPLDAVLDIGLRVSAFGSTYGAFVIAEGLAPQVAVLAGQPAIVYANRQQRLSLDLDGSIRSLAGTGGTTRSDVRLSGSPYLTGLTVQLAFPAAQAFGPARRAAELWVSKDMVFAAELVSDGQDVTLTAPDVIAPPGTYRLGLQAGDRGGWTSLRLAIDEFGGASIPVDA